MLVVRMTLLAGRDERQIEALHAQLAAAAAEELGWPLAEVRTLIHELPASRWGAGGRSLAARREAAR
jgi:4-oxalocrotonate tautomerase